MKGKILIFFILALAALVVVGIIGQTSISRTIASIEKASAPNEKIRLLDEIFQNLLEAENSVRTYSITGNERQLAPFSEAAATIDAQLNNIRQITSNKEQRALLKEIDQIIEQKFSNFSSLIGLQETGVDRSAMDRVLADIESLKSTDTSLSDADTNGSIFKKLFGKNKKRLMSDSLFFDSTAQDLSSARVGEAIARISEEQQRERAKRVARELELSQFDYALTDRFRALAIQYEAIDNQISANQAQRVAEASARANNYIRAIIIATLLSFALLLYILFVDISRNQKNKNELQKAKERAESLARAKEEFLAKMSHEIRTPLNAVIGFSDQLAQQPLNKNQQETVRKIKYSGDHLLHIVNDILDTAKMDSGKITLETIPMDPAKELLQVVQLFENDAKDIALIHHVSENVPAVLLGDPTRLRQIIINLLSNAIKFTMEGYVKIEMSGSRTEEDLFQLEIKISDSGIGIPAHLQKNMFEDFSQADSSTTRKYGGTGLGLSIVKKLTTMHSGAVSIESREGDGTTVTVALQYRTGHIEDLAIEKTPTSIPHLEHCKILLVDDEPFNLEIAESMLLATGASIMKATSGEEALAALKRDPVDLVLMDVQMPDISGTEITRMIRSSNGPNQTTPIKALTAGATEQDSLEILASGMNEIILKPLDRATLYHALDQCLSAPKEHIQLDELKVLSNGDGHFVVRMLKLFQTNVMKDLGELETAVAKDEKDKIKSMAHKMIPPCRHLGLTNLVGELQALESTAIDDATIPGEAFDRIRTLILQAVDEVGHELITLTAPSD